MADKRRTNGTAIQRGGGHFWLSSVVSLLSAALLIAQSGCRAEARSSQGPAAESQPDNEVEMSTLASAQEPAPDAPVISLEKTVHDFGEIGPGTSHTAKFKFTNTGKTPLIITRVSACCGTATKGVRNGQRFAPGRSGELEVEYRASTMPGDMKNSLYIYSNDPVQGIVPLTIQAKIMRRIETDPTNLKLFSKRENAGAKDITVTSLDGRPFAITSFRSTGDALTANFDPAVEATKFVLKPQVNMERLERYPRGQIRVTLTHPECPETAVLYDLVPEYTVTPPQIIIFDLVPGQTSRREVWILGNYEDDFEIESVTSQKGILKLAEIKKVKGAARNWVISPTEERTVTRHQLQIDITPPAEGNPVVLRDVLEVRIEGGETIPIQFQGYFAGN
ncbi:MAG: DUF1573 domain-containing protein [Sedimentisphaerales bacterium]|nr:DUF1573 domain-containing protein [Sedimentisphaerales bacterium]